MTNDPINSDVKSALEANKPSHVFEGYSPFEDAILTSKDKWYLQGNGCINIKRVERK